MRAAATSPSPSDEQSRGGKREESQKDVWTLAQKIVSIYDNCSISVKSSTVIIIIIIILLYDLVPKIGAKTRTVLWVLYTCICSACAWPEYAVCVVTYTLCTSTFVCGCLCVLNV